MKQKGGKKAHCKLPVYWDRHAKNSNCFSLVLFSCSNTLPPNRGTRRAKLITKFLLLSCSRLLNLHIRSQSSQMAVVIQFLFLLSDFPQEPFLNCFCKFKTEQYLPLQPYKMWQEFVIQQNQLRHPPKHQKKRASSSCFTTTSP